MRLSKRLTVCWNYVFSPPPPPQCSSSFLIPSFYLKGRWVGSVLTLAADIFIVLHASVLSDGEHSLY